MGYEDGVQELLTELETEVASLTLALAKSREDNDELVEENARLVAENETIGREYSVLLEKLNEERGPY